MVGTLETRLGVTTGEGIVEISITWPDAQMARRLVEAAAAELFRDPARV